MEVPLYWKSIFSVSLTHLHVELLAQPRAEALHAVDLQAVLRLVRQAAVAGRVRRACKKGGRKTKPLQQKDFLHRAHGLFHLSLG